MFCEKPLSQELDECLAVEAEAAQHPRLKVMIGFVRRFDPSYEDAHRRIAAGGIVVGLLFFIELLELQGRKRIPEKYPVFTLVKTTEDKL